MHYIVRMDSVLIEQIGNWIGQINKAHTGICKGCPIYPRCKLYDSCDIAIKAILRNNIRNEALKNRESGQLVQRSN